MGSARERLLPAWRSAAVCQPVGLAAHDAGLDGADCRSAAAADGRELAWLPRTKPTVEVSRLAFDRWWSDAPTKIRTSDSIWSAT